VGGAADAKCCQLGGGGRGGRYAEAAAANQEGGGGGEATVGHPVGVVVTLCQCRNTRRWRDDHDFSKTLSVSSSCQLVTGPL
jgi:hypothetical protein